MALTSAIASAYLSVSRWKLSTQPLPDKVIVIGAPHTSNWDGVFMAISMWKSGRTFSFLVKDSVVKAPLLGWSKDDVAAELAAYARRCTALAQAEKETEDAAAAAHLDGLGQV